MFYGTNNFEYYDQTDQAVFAVFKKGCSKVVLIAYSMPKSKLKMHITEVDLRSSFRPKHWPTPVHRISGINDKVLRTSFKGSLKHQRILGKIVKREFMFDILEVLTCRQDHNLIQEYTAQ